MKPVVVVDILTKSISFSVMTELYYISYSLVIGQELYCKHCTCIVHYIIEDPCIDEGFIDLISTLSSSVENRVGKVVIL